jgi:hypothetical protein
MPKLKNVDKSGCWCKFYPRKHLHITTVSAELLRRRRAKNLEAETANAIGYIIVGRIGTRAIACASPPVIYVPV